ncbi:MAG: hypothetical protein Kow0025_05280 [Thermodesulfovibrionales bacterium]
MAPRKFTLFLALTLALFALSCQRASGIEPINTTAGGVAIKGYDTVAYFLDGMPVKGSAEYEYAWKGAKWRFASAEHRDLFASDPEKYAPQYGGY